MINYIVNEINEMLKKQERVIIAIDGQCCSGKTSLAEELSKIFDCNVYHMDDYFLPLNKRTEKRFHEIGGNVDYERFNDEIIHGLKSGQSFSYQTFSCQIMDFDRVIDITPKEIEIIEGSYSLHSTLIKNYDLKILLKISDVTQIQRLKKRNPKQLQTYIEKWIPLENKYLATLNESELLIYDNN